MGRSPCCAKEGINRGAWSANEDKILSDFIENHGEGGWRTLPKKAGLNRCGKSCRLRWLNYLRPDIKRGNILPDEEDLIIRLHKLLGNRWSLIAGRLPGRTDNEIKNYWNTTLGKRVHQAAGQNIRNTRKAAAAAAEKTHKKTKALVANKTSSSAALVPVVRTKAVKCTRAIITNPANSVTNFNQIDHKYGPSSPSSVMINATNDDATNVLQGGGSSGVSKFSDFLMDSDIFGLFDFGQQDCGSEIDNININNYNNIAGDHHEENIHQLPPGIFPEEMLQNFCGSAVNSSVADPLESPNLDNFTSLLDFGWILETIDEGDETNYTCN